MSEKTILEKLKNIFFKKKNATRNTLARVRLNAEHFKLLISGQVVYLDKKVMGDDPEVQIILADIGYPLMREIIYINEIADYNIEKQGYAICKHTPSDIKSISQEGIVCKCGKIYH